MLSFPDPGGRESQDSARSDVAHGAQQHRVCVLLRRHGGRWRPHRVGAAPVPVSQVSVATVSAVIAIAASDRGRGGAVGLLIAPITGVHMNCLSGREWHREEQEDFSLSVPHGLAVVFLKLRGGSRTL
jgi:hypothetical protein